MDAETKLQEMCDRGWQLKISTQKSSATWNVVGALDGWLLCNDEHTYATYGIHTSLLSALLDMEKMLIDAEIQNCIEHQQGGTDQDQKYYSSRLKSMRSIKQIGLTLTN